MNTMAEMPPLLEGLAQLVWVRILRGTPFHPRDSSLSYDLDMTALALSTFGYLRDAG